MFEGPDYPVSLSEDEFDTWLEKGRESRIKYEFMLVIFNEMEGAYHPIYVETLAQVYEHGREFSSGLSSEGNLIAAYNLYSESKVNPFVG